jgi:hypothetical protein
MKDLLSHVRGSSVFVQPVFRFSFVRLALRRQTNPGLPIPNTKSSPGTKSKGLGVVADFLGLGRSKLRS